MQAYCHELGRDSRATATTWTTSLGQRRAVGAPTASPREAEGARRDGTREASAVVAPRVEDRESGEPPTVTAPAEHAADEVAGNDGALPDLLDAYLREIGHTSLLTPEQEITLAQRVERGDKAAADAMVQANLRLVVSVARRYLRRGLPLEDLIAEGNIGLLHAVQKYDWQRGYRFSTYAVWWIRQAISRAIGRQGQTIRVPAHVGDTLANRARRGGQRAAALGREPTPDELDATPGAEVAGVGAAVVVTRTPLSLQMAVGEDGEEHLIDVLPDDEAVSPEDGAVGRLAAEEIRQVLTEALSARERAVLTLRFGLDGASPETLDVVGRRLGLTRERVRQIEAEALRKLRRPAVVAHLYAS